MIYVFVAIGVFLLMEPITWATHKYVMHGFLWVLHRDHHQVEPGFFEKNDAFFVIFAVPSMLLIGFGTYDGVVANASTALKATATIISTCTSGAAAQITMNAGAYEGSVSTDVPVRRMTAGTSEYLVYQVYSDVSRKTIWGNSDPTGVSFTGTGAPQTLTVYGSIPSAQIVPEGEYSDQIIVTITY